VDEMNLKIMADYDSSPLWVTGPGVSRNLPVDELPISSALASELQEWADVYTGTLNREDPMSSGFSTPELKRDFAEKGKELAVRLAAELGGDHVVSYFDEVTGVVRPVS
jgi:hypothetical protein